MFIYISKKVKNYYFTIEEELAPTAYEIGTTLADFYEGKWVLLSEEQTAFHEEHPNASVTEVWNMELIPTPVPHIRDIDDAKREKKEQIDNYDNSSDVNGFEVNGNTAWFTADERANYRASIESAKLLNVSSISFYIGDTLLTLPTEQVELLLAQLQLYADQCFIVTKQHKANVDALETIEEVDNYDYMTGYPQKITITL